MVQGDRAGKSIELREKSSQANLTVGFILSLSRRSTSAVEFSYLIDASSIPCEEVSRVHVQEQHEGEVRLPGDHDVEGGAHHNQVPPVVHRRQGEVRARTLGLGLAK